MIVIGLCCIWYIWAQNWELDKVKLGSLSSWLRKLYDFFFFLIVVCLFQDLHRCDLLDFRTEQNCFTNANVRSKTSWSKQKSFSWLWWLWSSPQCVCSRSYMGFCVFVCWGEEERDICAATYPDFEVLVLCNWLRGVFKLPNLGTEITVAFRLRTEKVKQPNLSGGQAPHLPVKSLNLYVHMKHLL